MAKRAEKTARKTDDLVHEYAWTAVGMGLGFGILTAMWRIGDKSDARYLLGQGLFATLVGVLVTIFTVSSISVIPYIYWCVAGLGEAYRLMAFQSAKTGTSAHSRVRQGHRSATGAVGS